MTASSVQFGRKAVILAVIISVAAMFVTSFVYRMNNPNLQVQARQGPPAPQDHDHDGDGVQDHGDDPQAPPGMGGAMGGDMAQIKTFMDRVAEDPSDYDALVNLGKAFLMMRAWDRALEPLHKASQLDPKNTNILKGIGIAHFNMEKFDKAAESYAAILKVDENDTLALFNLGVINKHYFKKDDVARTYFEKVLALEKEDTEMIKLAKQELAK